MTFCSGCTTSNLIKFGEGNIKSLIILTLSGIAAISTMRGSLGSIRIHLFEDNFLARKINNFFEYKVSFGIYMEWLWPILLLTCLAFLFLKQVKNLEIRKNAIWGFIIGACIVGAWFVSGNIGFVAEHPDTLESRNIYLLIPKNQSHLVLSVHWHIHSNSFFTKVIVVGLFHLELLFFPDYYLVPIYQPVYKKGLS